MENLLIEKSVKTPLVEFNVGGELRISGRSIPENPMGFFSPILAWLDEYTKLHPKTTILHIDLEYFNTSSGKMMLNIMKYMEHMVNRGIDAKVYWYYHEDDEEIEEAGKSYEQLIKVPFRFVEIV